MSRPLRSVIVTFCMCLSSVALAQTSTPAEFGPQPASSTPPNDGAKFPWHDSAPQPAAPASILNGAIAIRALQGTPGAPAIGSIPVNVEIRHRGTTINTITTQTDEHGIAMIENLPVSMGIQPVVRVEYADLFYQVEGGLMDATHPQQQIDVVCYEPTEEPPPWKVQMRHVMIAPMTEGLAVTEVLVIENPNDRTWIGMPMGSRRATTTFALPAGATKVTLGQGFHDWSTSTLMNGRLVNHLPLMPEITQMVYSYVLPAASGSVSLDLEAPARVDHMLVLAPESLAAQSFIGMELGGVESMGDTTMRSYMASNLQMGDRANITFVGLPTSAGSPADAAATGGTASMAKIIAGAGAGVILLLGVGVILLKPRRSSSAAAKPAHVR